MAKISKHRSSDEVHYSERDRKPFGETQLHVSNLFHTAMALESWFADDPQVFIAGALIPHYVEGDGRSYVRPDLFVARDVANLPPRCNYLLWKEGKGPDVVIEFTCPETEEEDRETKMALYRDALRVPEYFLFDPHGKWLKSKLRGYRPAAARTLCSHTGRSGLPAE